MEYICVCMYIRISINESTLTWAWQDKRCTILYNKHYQLFLYVRRCWQVMRSCDTAHTWNWLRQMFTRFMRRVWICKRKHSPHSLFIARLKLIIKKTKRCAHWLSEHRREGETARVYAANSHLTIIQTNTWIVVSLTIINIFMMGKHITFTVWFDVCGMLTSDWFSLA